MIFSCFGGGWGPTTWWPHATPPGIVVKPRWALSGSEVFGGRYDAYRPLPRSLVSPLMMLEHSGTVCTGRTGGVRVTLVVSGFAAIRLMVLASDPHILVIDLHYLKSPKNWTRNSQKLGDDAFERRESDLSESSKKTKIRHVVQEVGLNKSSLV